jgi:hypothetical protein
VHTKLPLVLSACTHRGTGSLVCQDSWLSSWLLPHHPYASSSSSEPGIQQGPASALAATITQQGTQGSSCTRLQNCHARCLLATHTSCLQLPNGAPCQGHVRQ